MVRPFTFTRKNNGEVRVDNDINELQSAIETIDAGGTNVGAALMVSDEGVALSTAATVLDFVGSGVAVSGVGATKTVSIPGAAGGSGNKLAFLVAANNTPTAFKNLADYVCDGVDDHVQINAAIDAAAASTVKSVIVLPGQCNTGASARITTTGIQFTSYARITPQGGAGSFPLLYLPNVANGGQQYYHAVKISGEYYGSTSHGVFIEGATGEGFYMEAACNNNAGDGLRHTGGGTPSRFGWIMAHNNGGAGVHIIGSATNVDILGISADGNVDSALAVENLQPGSAFHLGGLKLERRSTGTHAVGIRLIDLDGANVAVDWARFSHDTTVAAPSSAAVVQTRTVATKNPGVFSVGQVLSSVWTDNIADKWPYFYDNQIINEQTRWAEVRGRGFAERSVYAPASASLPVAQSTRVQYDTFTAADGTTISARTPDTGTAWTLSGTWTIQGNRAEPGATNNLLYKDVADANVHVRAVVNLGNEAVQRNVEIMFRRQDASNFWYWRLQREANGTGSLQLYRVSGGSHTQLKVTTVTVAASTDYTLGVLVDGAWASCQLDGIEYQRWYVGDLAASATAHGVKTAARGTATPFVRFDNLEILT